VAAGRSRASSPWQTIAATKKASRWTAMIGHRTSVTSMTSMIATVSASGGSASSIQRCSDSAREPGAKTMLNDSRYSDSGIAQNSGIGAMSVVRYVVTPSIRLDGTNARPIQRRRRASDGRPSSAVGGSASAGAAWATGFGRARRTTTTQASMSAASSP
jgi:hypothetical protein